MVEGEASSPEIVEATLSSGAVSATLADDALVAVVGSSGLVVTVDADEVTAVIASFRPAALGDVQTGPAYGGREDVTFVAGAAVAMPDLGSDHDALLVGVVVTMPTVESVHDALTASSEVTMPRLESVHSTLTVAAIVSMSNLATMGHDVVMGAAVSMPTMGATMSVLVGAAATMPTLGSEHALGASAAVTLLRIEVSAALAAKDVWVPTAALCPDDSNKDGTDLECRNLAGVSNRDMYVSFDLSAFSGLAVVLGTTLTLNRITGGGEFLANVFAIADEDEGWDEATLTCGNRPPADGPSFGQAGFGTSAGEMPLVLGSGPRARIEARLGTSSCTFLFQAVLNDDATFESKDEGTNDSLGPRLTLVLEAP